MERSLSGTQLSRFSSELEAGLAKFNLLIAPLKQPARVTQMRHFVLALALVWLVVACAQVVWALLPYGDTDLPRQSEIVNPIQAVAEQQSGTGIDIDEMLSWHLLGQADAAAAVAVPVEPVSNQATGREGIEDGASETRLDLRLRGIVASSSDGLGHAIIEHKSKQQVYAVEDKLPLSGRVSLAKVMRDRVVIDNKGTYELLLLFEDSPLSAQVPAPAPVTAPGNDMADRLLRAIDKRGDMRATASAKSLRETLYKDPQSLADLVQVSAVRRDGVLQGYKVAPGAKSAQFKQLGFRSGDMITSVNGIALDDPGNTVRLYQLMRSAEEAVFDLERDGEPLTVTVGLDATATEQ
jgi:general secretion pathway protein C